jgi:Predicted transcriptional regulators
METIGDRIRYARKRGNLTISQVKEVTGLSVGNLSDIENSKIFPSSNALIKLSEALQVSTDWILTGKEFNLSKNNIQEVLSEKDVELLKKYNLLSEDKQRDIQGFINVSLNSRKND